MKSQNMRDVFFNKDDIVKVDGQRIVYLKQAAVKGPCKTTRLCLHKDIRDSLHEMVIVHCKDKYIRPHKHERKPESLHVIEGSFFLIIFDDNGRVIDKILMDRGSSKGNLLCRLEKSIWHTLIPLSDFIVFLEVTKGPFDKKDNIFASWAPKESDSLEVRKFLKKMLNIV